MAGLTPEQIAAAYALKKEAIRSANSQNKDSIMKLPIENFYYAVSMGWGLTEMFTEPEVPEQGE